MWRVGQELREVVAGSVVEGEARDLPPLRVEVLELLASQLGLLAEHFLLCVGEQAVEAANAVYWER